MYPFPNERLHPAVIISNDETCSNADILEVNALICTTARLDRPPKPVEATLDESDGLDWKTFVRCDRIFLLEKSALRNMKGTVTPQRKHEIARKIIESLRLPIHRP